MARSAHLKRRSASASQPSIAKGKSRLAAEGKRRSTSTSTNSVAASMALTCTATHSSSSSSNNSSSTPVSTTHVSSPSLPHLNYKGDIAKRKRARASTASRSGSSPDSDGQPSFHTRSPSVNAITAGCESGAREARPRHSDTLLSQLSAGRLSAPCRRLQNSATRVVPRENSSEGEELFVDASYSPVAMSSTAAATTATTPLRHLQGTPTSQLLSQLQDLPYIAQSTETREVETGWETAALFTPATVARRRGPLAVAGEIDARHSAASITTTITTSASGSRGSVHDEAVQAILRANPPTTTRAVELKPGYHVPSPRSPLWATFDADSDTTEGRRTRGSIRREEEEERDWTNTQVSLFQEDEEACEAGATPRQVPALIASTHEKRRLDARRSAQDSISLPAPGRSVNLLDDEGLHDDERLPLFVGERDTPSRAGGNAGPAETSEEESFVFSLTQEACKQERESDHQATLPRSRCRRRTATATSMRASASITPSPTRRSTHTRRSASLRASPFSQLQRDVELASQVAAARATGTSAAAAATATPPFPMLSQRELQRRADMLKWAERTRAFFHFIDSLPLHVANSPKKPAAQSLSQQRQQTTRRGRSTTIVAVAHPSRSGSSSVRGGQAMAASMSLVRRSHSAAAVAPAPATRHGSAAFEAVVSRVKREAAAASQQQRRSATAASRPSAH
ncbi:hypothetical protein N2W54_007093 [Lotmaria passim]